MRKQLWKFRLRGWRWALVLSILMAFVVLGITLFLNSFYSYTWKGYDPFDQTRGNVLEHRKASSTPE